MAWLNNIVKVHRPVGVVGLGIVLDSGTPLTALVLQWFKERVYLKKIICLKKKFNKKK